MPGPVLIKSSSTFMSIRSLRAHYLSHRINRCYYRTHLWPQIKHNTRSICLVLPLSLSLSAWLKHAVEINNCPFKTGLLPLLEETAELSGSLTVSISLYKVVISRKTDFSWSGGIKRVHCALKTYCYFQNTKLTKRAIILKKHTLNAAIFAPGHSGSESNAYFYYNNNKKH